MMFCELVMDHFVHSGEAVAMRIVTCWPSYGTAHNTAAHNTVHHVFA
jgi:hypothetical protein